MNSRMTATALGIAAALLTVAVAHTAPTPAQRCEASKIKAAGKAVASRAKCEQKGLAKGTAADPACAASADGKLADAFAKAEAKGGCDGAGDVADVQKGVDACLDDFLSAIGGDGSCSAGKMKAVGAMTYAASKCWQKGSLAGAPAETGCLAAAELKFDSAIAKADGLGSCTDTAAVLEALVEACVEGLRAPATTTTTSEPTTTTEESTTTTSEEPATTTTSTIETTTTTVPTPTMNWVFCAHAGETCVLPRHDQVVSFGGIPPATAWVRTVEDESIECSRDVLFPGQQMVAPSTGDCYFLDVGCDNDARPIGVIAAGLNTDPSSDFQSAFVLQDPPLGSECFDDPHLCELQYPLIADFAHTIAVVAVDPRVCGPDDRAHLSYHWSLMTRYPGFFWNEPHFVPQGITGYRESVLNIMDQSMPNTDGEPEEGWYAFMDITQEPHEDFPLTTEPLMTRHRFFFQYEEASNSMADAENCIQYPESCGYERLRRAPEGTY